MGPEMRSLEVVLLAVVILAGLRWQVFLFQKDSKHPFPPRRLYLPLLASLCVFVGYACIAVLSLVDERKPEFGIEAAGELLFKAVIFTVALNVKTFLGPWFVAYSIGGAIYCYFEYQELRFWPLLDVLLDWVFDGTPRWFKYAYLALTTVYSLVSSIVDGWEDNVSV